MFINNFNKIIISELRYVLSEIPEEERTAENLIDKFSEYIGGENSKKSKKPSKAKEPVESGMRCQALKKDGDQCNGKKNNKENSEINVCALHQRIGAKFGYLVSEPENSSTLSDTEEPEITEIVVASSSKTSTSKKGKSTRTTKKETAPKKGKAAKSKEIVVNDSENEDDSNDIEEIRRMLAKNALAERSDDDFEEDFENKAELAEMDACEDFEEDFE